MRRILHMMVRAIGAVGMKLRLERQPNTVFLACLLPSVVSQFASQISDAILTLLRNAEPFCCWLDIEKVRPPSSTFVSDSHPGSSRGHTNLGSSSRWRKRNDNYPSDSTDHNSGRASWVHVSQPRTHVFQPLTLALVLLSTSLLEKLSNLSDGQQYLDSCKVPSCWAKRLDT